MYVTNGADHASVTMPSIRGQGQIGRIEAAERRHYGRVVAEALRHIGQVQQTARSFLGGVVVFIVGPRKRNREFLSRADAKDGIVAESGTDKGRLAGQSAQVAEHPQCKQRQVGIVSQCFRKFGQHVGIEPCTQYTLDGGFKEVPIVEKFAGDVVVPQESRPPSQYLDHEASILYKCPESAPMERSTRG